MPADETQPMNYERYILPHRLPDVRPRERPDDPLRENPDEAFFIRTHQAFEIWFAQILAELEYARLLLSQPAPGHVPESDIPAVEQHVRRATGIFDLISRHLPLLETLKTTSFYNFRKHLFGASGTQSHRFREVEWLLGLLDDDLLEYTEHKRDLARGLADDEKTAAANGPNPGEREHAILAKYQDHWRGMRATGGARLEFSHFKDMPATHAALQARLDDIAANGSLRQHALSWLARAAFPAPRGGRPDAKFGAQFAEKFSRAYMAAHSKDAELLRALQEMDSNMIDGVHREAQQKVAFFLDAPHRRAIVFLLQFATQPLLAWPASLVEALLELDQAFANWRDRHIAMVARVLGGGRISTLGAAGSGLLYLRETTFKRAFPEIMDARTFMLSDEEATGIYGPKQLSPFGFVSESRPSDNGGDH